MCKRTKDEEVKEPFTLIEISTAINQMKIGKVAGHKEITLELLKYLPIHSIKHVLEIINGK